MSTKKHRDPVTSTAYPEGVRSKVRHLLHRSSLDRGRRPGTRVDASVELACNMVLSLLVSQQSDMDLELLAEHVAPS